MPKLGTITLGYIFPFGKHRGRTVLYIIENDVTYIEWAIDKNILLLDTEADNVYQETLEEYNYEMNKIRR